MKWREARKACLKIQAAHDRDAARAFKKNSCGYCQTEDCRCEGYGEECDCGFCEDVFNKENKTGYPIAMQSNVTIRMTWNDIFRSYNR